MDNLSDDHTRIQYPASCPWGSAQELAWQIIHIRAGKGVAQPLIPEAGESLS